LIDKHFNRIVAISRSGETWCGGGSACILTEQNIKNINFTIKMAIETERKFLVKGEFRHLAVQEIKITQSYLAAEPDKTIRLRLSDNNAFLTIKSRKNSETISRNEWEFQIPAADAVEMMDLCLPGKIVKTRYLIPSAGHTFEVDVFHDKNDGLVIAEIELSSENEKFEKPDWLGEEVTGKPEYYNSNLTK
jgi:adenylate cyclase